MESLKFFSIAKFFNKLLMGHQKRMEDILLAFHKEWLRYSRNLQFLYSLINQKLRERYNQEYLQLKKPVIYFFYMCFFLFHANLLKFLQHFKIIFLLVFFQSWFLVLFQWVCINRNQTVWYVPTYQSIYCQASSLYECNSSYELIR